jgi:murein tripeptide amidase MpaA
MKPITARMTAWMLATTMSLPAVASDRAPLPPEAPWSGGSEEIALEPGEPWSTPFEDSGQSESPDYAATMSWLERLEAASPEVSIVSIGRSGEGRELVFVVASREGAATPDELAANGRPTLLAQAGIHAGEIDGKDAAMMLLRDLTVRGARRDLLEGANLIVLPIFNVDGHERRSEFSRMNQRGPEIAGWRTNARNLNLNRDYAKVDAPEMRALLAALGEWPIDLYYDLHATDGADYQYDITYGWNGRHGWSPAIATWLDEVLRPAADGALVEAGHIPGPLVFLADKLEPGRGMWDFTASPRYSNGYGDLRHLPTVLVENHSLKPFRQRVLGTYVLLAETLRVLGESGDGLRRAKAADGARRPMEVALGFRRPEGPAPMIEFLGVAVESRESQILGEAVPVYTGERVTLDMPVLSRSVPDPVVSRPVAYWVPAAWTEVIERLAAHGVEMERFDIERRVGVERYRFRGVDLADEPYEGRVRVEAEVVVESEEVTFPAGSVRVTTDQPLGDLVVYLLEPQAEDSFFQWGFFLEVLTRTEYAESYAMEPLAAQMLEADPGLRAEFERRLDEDEAFRKSPSDRLRFFYERTPYWDERYLLYPVARER